MNQLKLANLVNTGPLLTNLIHIEALYRRGLPHFLISGMTGSRGRELTERIRSAIICSGIQWPLGQIQVHLSPADLPKSGAHLDLAIAVALMQCFEKPDSPDSLINHSDILFLGELSLGAKILPVKRSILLALKAASFGFKYLAVCEEDLNYASFSDVDKILVLKDLQDVFLPIDHTRFVTPKKLGRQNLKRAKLPEAPTHIASNVARAISASCAGHHSLLMIGPPGSGKSTIARFLHSLLPAPDPKQGLELVEINDQHSSLDENIQIVRPMQSPHHSCTRRAMIGGGQPITTGEVSRAHHGILLLDELSEFKRDTLQALREPLLDKCVHMSRGNQTLKLPANFLLIATSNPCPCGYFGSNEKQCYCRSRALKNYMQLLLGPLRDRIEIELFVGNIQDGNTINVQDLVKNIDSAVDIQRKRYKGLGFTRNQDIPLSFIDKFCTIEEGESQDYWTTLLEKNSYSQRALDAIRRLARTLADLDLAPEIRAIDLREAAKLRLLDAFYLDKGQ